MSGPPPTVNGFPNLRDMNRYCKAEMYGKSERGEGEKIGPIVS